MEPNYISSVREHVQECVNQLDQMATLLKTRELTTTEYLAVERLLQILIESSIGFAKQWVKSLGQNIPSDAYRAFLALHDQGKLNSDELMQWKKIIGLRNILVHEYLNIERSVIEYTLKNQLYLFIYHFVCQKF